MASHIERRKFLATLGGAAVAWPLAARAQQPAKLPIVGFLGSNASAWSPWTAAFVQRLRELGWIEGRTVAIEYRGEGRIERSSEIADEFAPRRENPRRRCKSAPTVRLWCLPTSRNLENVG